MRYTQLSLVALLVLILAVFPLVGCTSTDEIQTFVGKTQYISMRARAFNKEALNVINAMSADELSTLGSNKAHYCSYQHDRLLQDLASLECPKECLKLRDYMREYLTLSSKAWSKYYLNYSLGDESHWIQANSYKGDADRALMSAYGERERLGKKYNFDPTMPIPIGGDE
ncbi:hypothetical protein ACFLT8_03030 [Chloroflexota bacterium]